MSGMTNWLRGQQQPQQTGPVPQMSPQQLQQLIQLRRQMQMHQPILDPISHLPLQQEYGPPGQRQPWMQPLPNAQMSQQHYQQMLHQLWQQMHSPQQPMPRPGTMPPGQVPFGAPAGGRGGGSPFGGLNPSSLRIDFHPPESPEAPQSSQQ